MDNQYIIFCLVAIEVRVPTYKHPCVEERDGGVGDSIFVLASRTDGEPQINLYHTSTQKSHERIPFGQAGRCKFGLKDHLAIGGKTIFNDEEKVIIVSDSLPA